jgi:hypothetical protein
MHVVHVVARGPRGLCTSCSSGTFRAPSGEWDSGRALCLGRGATDDGRCMHWGARPAGLDSTPGLGAPTSRPAPLAHDGRTGSGEKALNRACVYTGEQWTHFPTRCHRRSSTAAGGPQGRASSASTGGGVAVEGPAPTRPLDGHGTSQNVFPDGTCKKYSFRVPTVPSV